MAVNENAASMRIALHTFHDSADQVRRRLMTLLKLNP